MLAVILTGHNYSKLSTMSIYNEAIGNPFLKGIVKTYMEGHRGIKRGILSNVALFLSSLALIAINQGLNNYKILNLIGIILTILSVILFIIFYAYTLVKADEQAKKEIEKVEERIKEYPNESMASWELAKIRLESYLNRNLSQLRSIFNWTMIIMIVGFLIIGYGIIKVYHGDQSIKPSIITITAGLLVEFIGATFLIIYKSTMEQAKGFINVLERINAVGMSVQIVDRIEEDQPLKNKTGAEIAKQLLELYATNLK